MISLRSLRHNLENAAKGKAEPGESKAHNSNLPVSNLGKTLPDRNTNQERDDQHDSIGGDFEIWNDNLCAVNDDLAQDIDPEGHHEKCRKCGHSSHSNRKIKISPKHDSPNIGCSTPW